MIRALAAGVILSLALVHVIPDGAADLAGLYGGPLAECMVFAGILLMIVVENLWYYSISSILHPPHERGEVGELRTHSVQLVGGRERDDSDFVAMPSKLGELRAHTVQLVGGRERAGADGDDSDFVAMPSKVSPVSDSDAGPTPAVVAYLFEAASIVHSFLIAIALGTVIVKARFSTRKSITMVASFAVVTPVGIGIGMGVVSSYDPESLVALTVQGILNSISGGLLLYIGLVQMVAEDFSRTSFVPGGLLVRLGSYFMFGLGAGCMALIAVFGEGS
ncbi:hypothetical protein FOA52_006197 [Chlamydomonas sp. UWO 241]|nr:hypothetical protein FOA52_006197 [Chlamydomonas sp. UWO 241]